MVVIFVTSAVSPATSSNPSWVSVVVLSGILIALLVIAGVVILMVRRRLFDEKTTSDETFSLQGLREMMSRGELSDEEYEAARSVILGTMLPEGSRSKDGTEAPDTIESYDPGKEG